MKIGIMENEEEKDFTKEELNIGNNKQIWDEIQIRDSTNINRFLESAKSTFNRANNSLLIDQIGLWKKGVYGKDPNIADALIEELKRRRWDKEAEGFMKWLTEHNYKEPWNN
jgi:hypothetical protein